MAADLDDVVSELRKIAIFQKSIIETLDMIRSQLLDVELAIKKLQH